MRFMTYANASPVCGSAQTDEPPKPSWPNAAGFGP